MYGQVKADLASVGKLIPENDIWIAAIARQFRLPLATRDAHFTAVPGLDTELVGELKPAKPLG